MPRIAETGSLLTVIEEAAEGIAKYLLGLPKVGEARMTAWLRIAAEFARVRAGLDPEFTHWLDVSAGLTAERRDAAGRSRR